MRVEDESWKPAIKGNGRGLAVRVPGRSPTPTPTPKMSKRSATALGTPAPKLPRVDGSPATSARPHGRVVLDGGGTRFVSSRTTLERASTYFSSLLARWDENEDEPNEAGNAIDALEVS